MENKQGGFWLKRGLKIEFLGVGNEEILGIEGFGPEELLGMRMRLVHPCGMRENGEQLPNFPPKNISLSLWSFPRALIPSFPSWNILSWQIFLMGWKPQVTAAGNLGKSGKKK